MTRLAMAALVLAACTSDLERTEPRRKDFAAELDRQMLTGTSVAATGPWATTLTISGGACDAPKEGTLTAQIQAMLADAGFQRVECVSGALVKWSESL